MVALRSLTADTDTVTAYLTEQQYRRRFGLCVFCDLPIRECVCGEYEVFDRDRNYATDDESQA